ncbi:PREDICTED: uncharacterized protein At2g39920 isoform X2 [Tarenaya hassleriana]|uniref:uncharacterized protein At2g39920 isoform X2 n=1 Tax=Tarenaya hassleriana TaxID=28532 RepID=UPI00053C592E|nr:PREDICTED: uncharacterized protein At2g39920 isoform X2 [Tarenaya hassleriana]
MSAYAHQMEREFSGLSSRGNSELAGSRYEIESGFYMTSFAATIFLASLLAVGVVMVTLLIALSAMLQNCQTRSSGIVEAQNLIESFSYCNALSLHSHLNGLKEFPPICIDIRRGIHLKELNFTVRMALTYFRSLTPLGDDSLDAVLIDIDDVLDHHFYSTLGLEKDGYQEYVEEARHQQDKLMLEMYSQLKSQGYSMLLLSRKSEGERNPTVEQLNSAGYSKWSRLIMREDQEMQDGKHEHLRRQIEEMEEGGYRIRGVISSHMDVLTLSRLRTRLFKLPSIEYLPSR